MSNSTNSSSKIIVHTSTLFGTCTNVFAGLGSSITRFVAGIQNTTPVKELESSEVKLEEYLPTAEEKLMASPEFLETVEKIAVLAENGGVEQSVAKKIASCEISTNITKAEATKLIDCAKSSFASLAGTKDSAELLNFGNCTGTSILEVPDLIENTVKLCGCIEKDSEVPTAEYIV